MRMMMRLKKGRSRKTKEEPNTASTAFSATDVSANFISARNEHNVSVEYAKMFLFFVHFCVRVGFYFPLFIFVKYTCKIIHEVKKLKINKKCFFTILLTCQTFLFVL